MCEKKDKSEIYHPPGTEQCSVTTEANYKAIAEKYKDEIKSKILNKKFFQAEEILKKLGEEVASEEQLLQASDFIFDSLDTEPFWTMVEDILKGSSEAEMFAVSQLLQKMPPSHLPKIYRLCLQTQTPEILYNTCATIGARDVTTLVEGLNGEDEEISYHCFKILERTQNRDFFKHVTELKKNSSPKVRSYSVKIIKTLNQYPESRITLGLFLKDESTVVIREVLRDPQDVADADNYDALLHLWKTKGEQLNEEDMKNLYKAMFLSDADKMKSWLSENFSKGDLAAAGKEKEKKSSGTQYRDPLIDKKLGPCVIIRKIGQGGMGSVYEAVNEGLDRRVAIKILSPQLAEEQSTRDRFVREARAAAKLASPNLVQVYSVGEAEGVSFIEMEFIDGVTLKDFLDRGEVPFAQVLKIFQDVIKGIRAAHSAEVVHRDIKPDNILVDKKGAVKLTDFGLAQVADSKNLTRSGVMLGTPYYLAPEQAEGEKADHRSDLYSLGATFYHLFLGKPPYTGESSVSIIYKHITAPFPSPQKLKPDFSPVISEVLEKLMAKNPDDRYDSANALDEDLEKRIAEHDLPLETPQVEVVKDATDVEPPSEGQKTIVEGLLELATPPAIHFLEEIAKRDDFPVPDHLRTRIAEISESLEAKKKEVESKLQNKEATRTHRRKLTEMDTQAIMMEDIDSHKMEQKIVEEDMATSDTQDLTDDSMVVIKEGSAPAAPPMETDNTLLLEVAEELYKSNPGSLLNLLQEFFARDCEPGDHISEQRDQLITLLCKKSDKNLLIFLDFLRTEDERFGLADNQKQVIKALLKEEGMLFEE